MKGEAVAERRPPSLHLGVDIKIPESYLADPGDRLALYKRIAQAADPAEIDRIRADTEDRFGHLPRPAVSLFEMAHLRLAAERIGVKAVDVVDDRLQIRFHDSPAIDPGRIIALAKSENGTLSPSGMLVLAAFQRGADRVRAATALLGRLGDPA
jgi:transcription-repair coupling factor (superfamily II helicase)